MNAPDDLTPLIGARLQRVPDLSAGERERILARLREEIHAAPRPSRARLIARPGQSRPAHARAGESHGRLLVGMAAVMAALVGGAALLVPTRPDPTLPGVAAVPSAALAASPVAIPTPGTSPALVMRWTTAQHPESADRQSVYSPWSDGVVTLLSAEPKLGRQTIWASEDAGLSWREADMVDQSGRAMDDVAGGGFEFTKDGPTYYAVGWEQEETSYGRDFNDRVLRSDDGTHWQLVTSHRMLPESVEWGSLANDGLVAVGSVLTPDTDGPEVRLVEGKPARFRSAPVVLRSTDGADWTVSATLPAGPAEQGCAFGPLTAPDGSMLVRGALWQPPAPRKDGPTCDSVPVRFSNGVAWWSADGITFQRVTSGPLAPGTLGSKQAGTFDGGFFVRLYDSDTRTTTLWTSADGDRWDAHPAPDGIGRQSGAVALDGGVFIPAAAPRDDIVGFLFSSDGRWLEVGGEALTVTNKGPSVEAAPGTIVVTRLGRIASGRVLIVAGTVGAP